MNILSLIIVVSMTSVKAATWNYDNNTFDWVNLGYEECGGNRQSPINLKVETECIEPLILEWTSQNESYAIQNNGHSLQSVPFEILYEGNHVSGIKVLHHTNDTQIRLKNPFYSTFKSPINSEYCFDSLHFHWGMNDTTGSEHSINGKFYPLEVHIVHYSCDFYTNDIAQASYTNDMASMENWDDDNILAVISVLFEVGAPNPVLDTILVDSIVDGVYQFHDPEHAFEDHEMKMYYSNYDVMDLLPENKAVIGYLGSLTTPPCYETIRWFVMNQTMTVSQDQLDSLRKILKSNDSGDYTAPNFRPLQDFGDAAKRDFAYCREHLDGMQVTKDVIEEDVPLTCEDQLIGWFIIGIVFICLFAVAMVINIWMAYMLYCDKHNAKVERKGSYQNVQTSETTNDAEA